MFEISPYGLIINGSIRPYLLIIQRISLNMQEDQSKNDALLFIEINSLAYKSNFKQTNVTLKLSLRRQKQVAADRVAIAQKQIKMSEQRCVVNQVGIVLCQIEFTEGQSKTNAYLRFPLEKLIEMPRVKHQIECKLVQKNWDRFFEGPLKNIVDMDLSIISYDHIIGKFVITSLQVALTRNTELVGQMDPYVQLILQGETKQTVVRENEGKHCVWNERIQFELSNINKGLVLTLNVMDKDNISSDQVGSCQINLVEQNLLIPFEQVKNKTYTLNYKKQSAGIIKVGYQFIPMPFNF